MQERPQGEDRETAPVILITGASSGIGAATARLFGQAGYRVALAARRTGRLAALAAEIGTGGGPPALPITADLARLDDIRRMTAAVLDRWGQIDVLFNNAGFGRLDWLEALDPEEDIAPQIEVNLLGLIQTTRQVLPHMIARRQGHIINMSSVAGYVGSPTYSIYAASKFGIRGFTDALRREVGIYGIRVSGIYPGSTHSEFSEKARIRRKTGQTMPARLKMSAEQVAGEVLRLAQRPRRAVILPWVLRLAVWADALLPGLVDRVVEARFTRRERGEGEKG